MVPEEFDASNVPCKGLMPCHDTRELGVVAVVSEKRVLPAGTWLHSMQEGQASAYRRSRDHPEKSQMPAGVRYCPRPGCRDQCCALTRMMKH